MQHASETNALQFDQRYRAALMSFFARRIRDRNEAEDLTQEVFARLASRNAAFVENADAYIFQMATNLLRDRSRRLGVRMRFQEEARQEHGVNLEELDPSRILIGRQNLRDVSKVLEGLPARTRTIFLLYRLEKVKKHDIADLYGISVSGVQKHLHKAMQHLIRSVGAPE